MPTVGAPYIRRGVIAVLPGENQHSAIQRLSAILALHINTSFLSFGLFGSRLVLRAVGTDIRVIYQPTVSLEEFQLPINGVIEKKIAAHLNAVEVDDAQGELIKAYCVRFKCSADYLFGFTPIESGDIEVRRICERTGLSEKAVLHLIQGIDGQADISHINLIWSRLLEDDLFFTLSSDWQAAYREACECIKSRAAGAAIVEALEEGELPSIEETLLFEKTKIASKKEAEHYAAYYGMLYKLSQDIANALDSLVEGQTKQENILERAHKNILMQYRRIIAKLKGEPLPPEPDDKEFEWNVHIL